MSISAQLRRRFEGYRPEVEKIVRKIKATGDPQQVDGYIDSGSDSDVFRLSDLDVVVKLPIENGEGGLTPKQVIKAYTQAYIAGIGVEGLAQIVAYNNNRRRGPLAVICDYAKGPTFKALNEADRSAIHACSYLGLFATFQAMQDRRLGADTGQGNFAYDKASGHITGIDYELNPAQTLAQKVVGFGSMEVLLNRLIYQDVVPDYGLLYRDACHNVFGGDMAAAVEAEWLRVGFRLP